MRPSSENISIHRFQLSETQPVIGLHNLHPERCSSRWDMHYGLELGLICSGKEHRFFLDKSERDFEAGDVWFCGMWEPHGMKVVSAPCEVIVLAIWPPLLAQTQFPEAPDFCALAPFNAPPKQRPRTSKKTKETMLKFGKQLKEIIVSDTPCKTLRIRFVLQDMLLRIFETWPEAASWRRRAPSAEFSQINRALEMVFQSHTFISTEDAARACGMDRHKYSALFRSWMNIGFTDFSLRHRLHQAANQLRNEPSAPIKEIARQWGFADESHFHRVFGKHFSASPREYRSHMFSVQNPG